MRTLVLAAMAALSLPCAAMADGGAPLPVGADGSVALQAGQDYVLVGYTGSTTGQVTLLGPDHATVVASTPAYPDGDGVEFRAPYSATYYLQTDSGDTSGFVEPDCRADLMTRCLIAAGHTKSAHFAWARDVDARRAYLRKGLAYRVTYDGSGSFTDASVAILDGKGRVLASTSYGQQLSLGFRPVATGYYYLRFSNAADERGGAYTLSLATR